MESRNKNGFKNTHTHMQHNLYRGVEIYTHIIRDDDVKNDEKRVWRRQDTALYAHYTLLGVEDGEVKDVSDADTRRLFHHTTWTAHSLLRHHHKS